MNREFTFELAQQLHDSNQIVDFDWAWQLLGYSRKDSAKRTLVSYFEAKFDYFVQLPEESPALPHDIFHIEVENSKPGRPAEKIYLTVECFKEMGMLAKSEEGKQIRKYFLQCEALAKQSVKAIPQLQQQIQQLQQSFEIMQSQIQNLLPISSDFIPPGWDADVWEKLPSQDKRHFRFIYRKHGFRPDSAEIEPYISVSADAILLQKQEVEQIIGEVSPTEMWRIEDAKQELLARFWAEGAGDE
jgi:phage anti-repressor protein